MSTWIGVPAAAAQARAGEPTRTFVRMDSVALGVAGWLISFIGSWIPSYSFDETVSMSMIHRTPGQLWHVLGSIDAVHGLYYFILQNWAAAFGDTRIITRLLSSIAIGLAVSVTYLVARRLSNRVVAVSSAIALILLPRSEWAATEARSYAMTALACALMLWLLVRAADRSTPGRWCAYGAAVALSCAIFAYMVFIPVALWFAILLVPRYRRRWLLTALSGIAGILVAMPLLLLVANQRGQVSWIPPISRATIVDIISQQWFLGDVAALAVYVILVVAGVVIALVRRHAKSTDLALLPFAIVPMVLVTFALVILSLVVTPLYTPRYLTLTAPAAALLAGWSAGVVHEAAASWTARRKLAAKPLLATAAAVSLVIAIVAAIPGYIDSRTPYANQSDYSQAADWIGAQARPGDAVIFAMPGYPFDMHVVQFASFQDLRALDDIMLKVSPADNNSYWGQQFPFSALSSRLGDHDRLFVVTNRDVPYPGSDIDRVLTKLGFTTQRTWSGPYSEVILAARKA